MVLDKSLRALFQRDGVSIAAGTTNVIGAKIIESNGFDSIWVSSLEASTSRGVPDASIITMSDMLKIASDISNSVDIPVIADCDTGYGDFKNVYYIVQQFEKNGVSAISIEDKMYPKLNSLADEKNTLISKEDFVDKIVAAKEAQQTKDFVFIARIEAFNAKAGLEVALERADCYTSAGADALIVHSVSKELDEIIEFCKSFTKNIPIIIIPTTYNKITVGDIEKLRRVKMVIYANQLFRAAVASMDKAAKLIKKAGTTGVIEGEIATLEDLFKYQELQQFKERNNRIVRKRKSIFKT